MQDINLGIQALATAVVALVRAYGGRMSISAVHRHLDAAGSEKVIRVTRLAIERAIGLKMIEPCGYGEIRLVERVPSPCPEELLQASREADEEERIRKASARPPKVKKPKKTHRLKSKGQGIRKGIVEALRAHGKVMRRQELFESLPERLRPKTMSALRHHLRLLIRAGRIARIAHGWYAHPFVEKAAQEEYESILEAKRREKASSRPLKPKAPNEKKVRPARKRARTVGSPHRLYERGKALRHEILTALVESGGVRQLGELHKALPHDLAQKREKSFNHFLCKMRSEGLLRSPAPGWYCLPDRLEEAEEQYRQHLIALEAARKNRPKRKRVKSSLGPNRHHVRGRALRRATLKSLLGAEGAIRGRDLHRRLPADLRPESLHSFLHMLHKMRDESLIVRLGQGWYCHPEHVTAGKAQYLEYRQSRHYLRVIDGRARTKEDVIDRMVRRREALVEILEACGKAMPVQEIFSGVRRKGFTAGITRLRTDIYHLCEEGRIVRKKYGWYGLPPLTNRRKPAP